MLREGLFLFFLGGLLGPLLFLLAKPLHRTEVVAVATASPDEVQDLFPAILRGVEAVDVPVERADRAAALGHFVRDVGHLERVATLRLQHLTDAVGDDVQRLGGTFLFWEVGLVKRRNIPSDLELVVLSSGGSLGCLVGHGSPRKIQETKHRMAFLLLFNHKLAIKSI